LPSSNYGHSDAQDDVRAAYLHEKRPEMPALDSTRSNETVYTILSEKEKRFTIILASFAALISPVSASIYFPALNSLSSDLHVSASDINLSITVYMVIILLVSILDHQR
jgi:ACR3 family arsenite efflux pump ArsB